MSLLRIFFGGAKDKAQDYLAKKRLEKKLGRKVSNQDLFSLAANLEASEAETPQPADSQFPAAPKSSAPLGRTGKIILAAIALGILLLLGVGVVFVAVQFMPEATYNRLNPFTPKVPAGLFPSAIAGYNLTAEPSYKKFDSYAQYHGFTTYYKKGDSSISFNVYVFKTPEGAAKYMVNRYFIGGVPRIAEQTDSRQVIIDRENGRAAIQFTGANYLVHIGARTAVEAVAFENDIPYAALGMEKPPVRTADGLVEKPIDALTILDEYLRDKAAVEAKYHGKPTLFSGIVAATGKTEKGNPYIAIQKPGAKLGLGSLLTCTFVAGDTAKVASLKIGDPVQFRGKVNAKLPMNTVVIEECRIQ